MDLCPADISIFIFESIEIKICHVDNIIYKLEFNAINLSSNIIF
jgi:hypothetical protein